MMEKRALITGLNGFTGYYLAAELARAGYTIFGADVKPDGAPNNFAVDLLDKAALRQMRFSTSSKFSDAVMVWPISYSVANC